MLMKPTRIDQTHDPGYDPRSPEMTQDRLNDRREECDEAYSDPRERVAQLSAFGTGGRKGSMQSPKGARGPKPPKKDSERPAAENPQGGGKRKGGNKFGKGVRAISWSERGGSAIGHGGRGTSDSWR